MRNRRFAPFAGFTAAAMAVASLAACSSTDDGSRDSMFRRGMDSIAAIGSKGKEERDTALIDSGTTAVATTESNSYMDKQEAELRKQLEPRGVKVERAGDQIILSVPSSAAFDPNKDQVKRSAQPLVGQVALVLKRYDRTTVDVYGHTDSGGDEKGNLDLTQRRALSVAKYLAAQGIDSKRLSVTGFGGSRPVGSNETEEGRQQNRRIEIQVSPVTKT